MRDKSFIDTNILIYLYSVEKEKQQKILSLFKGNDIFVINNQIMVEFCNVLLKKFKYKRSDIQIALDDFNRNFEVILIDHKIIADALNINEIYKYSFFDSLVIATALKAECNILYSEDMHNKQLISNKLTILNPLI